MAGTAVAQSIIRAANTASLGTLDRDGGPFVSLVTVAAIGPRTLAMLLSGLARHTQNLLGHPSASLLISQPHPGGQTDDPLAATRVTLVGRVQKLSAAEDSSSREAFLAAHPSAEIYAGFGDFAIFEFTVTEAHLVAGFGRIETISADDLS
ncbi:HugZ family pyridoxamine 5'-phosphate oxidase [Aporhodopirellula aestuarii]|uniref:CREG family protein n=1 Tax=Aporhodopirellula aestuarii TaxID=2950107 RepID=A0ABT0U5U0_9BACT|nr:CREG family protein [Aporhodopirellula aestuarii]MCM2372290.1 CREG family protein [Aporhodopirellula aestuarii]